GAHSGDAAALLDQIDGLRAHAQVERRITATPVGEKIEKVPLRHDRDELAAGRQIAKIGEGVLLTAEDCADVGRFLMRQLQEIVEQAELAHHVQRRGMNGVAAEIAQEVGMLREHDDVDAGAREQEAEHEPAWSAADDAATCGELLGCHWWLSVKCKRRAKCSVPEYPPGAQRLRVRSRPSVRSRCSR